MLQDAGADVINIADGPRATVRMSNLSLAVSIQRELNMEAFSMSAAGTGTFLGCSLTFSERTCLGYRILFSSQAATKDGRLSKCNSGVRCRLHRTHWNGEWV